MIERPALAGFACLIALAQASANEAPAARQLPARLHGVRVKVVRPAPVGAESLGVAVSGPYSPPAGSRQDKAPGFVAPVTRLPVEPVGGFTIKAGRDSPDAPMTGGLMFRF